MIWSRIANERGNVLLFTIGLLVLMLVMGGIAVDLAYYGVVDNELQRATDAAALAGAGKLGFDDTVFPTVRTFAQNYAAQNPWRNVAVGPTPVSLALNTANDPAGNIVLGIWNPTATPRFTPSLDGTQVNAVLCRTTAVPVSTTFFRLIGITTMSAFAESIAVANPPATPPPSACMFPMGLSSCFFGGATSAGCGATMTFISSSSESSVGVNSGAWLNLSPGEAPSANQVQGQITDAYNGGANCNPTISVGDELNVSNGMAQSTYSGTGNYPGLMDYFTSKYNASDTLTVKKSDGSTAYTGKGWEVFVPVIDSGPTCPPGAISGGKTIVGFTRFVIAQVSDRGECAVPNHYDGNPWDANCDTAHNGTATSVPPPLNSYRGIYGFYDCTYSPTPPTPVPTPRTALAQRLRLVE
jgi:Flp pilus assembly protein TadG